MIDTLLYKYVKKHAKETPEALAIVKGDDKVTYKQLDELTDNLALAFDESGIKRGDTVATYMPQSKEFILIEVAVAKLGARVMPLDIREKAPDIIDRCNIVKAKILITFSHFRESNQIPLFREIYTAFNTVKRIFIARGIEGSIPEPFQSFEELLQKETSDKDILKTLMKKVNENDDFIIIFTGGTTGPPKGAILTQKSCALADYYTLIVPAIDVIPGAIPQIFAGPPSHIGGSVQLVISQLMRGGKMVVLEHWRPDETLQITQDYRLPVLGGVPTMWRMFLNTKSFDQYDLSGVKVAYISGGPVTLALKRKIKEIMPNVHLFEGYGCTEASGLTHFTPFDAPEEKIYFTDGKTPEQIKCKIVDDDEKELPIGEAGQILVKSEFLMKGFIDSSKNKDVFTKDGWLRTGDMGKLDEDGYLTIVGRKKEMLKVKGYGVFVVKIDEYLQKLDDVILSAVVGMPHEIYGEVPAAFIKLKPGSTLTEDDIIQYCEKGLPDYEVPRKIIFKEEFPRTHSEKIDKPALRKELLEFLSS